jgi:hypothetical protein
VVTETTETVDGTYYCFKSAHTTVLGMVRFMTVMWLLSIVAMLFISAGIYGSKQSRLKREYGLTQKEDQLREQQRLVQLAKEDEL